MVHAVADAGLSCSWSLILIGGWRQLNALIGEMCAIESAKEGLDLRTGPVMRQHGK